MKRLMRKRPGVSEVVGALLLIIVVVTAVASLSYFLVNAQQNAQNRSSYLTDLKNENLQVVYASFSWQAVAPPPTHDQGTWNQVVLSVRNANTLSSGLQGILVNGQYISRWYQVSAPGPFSPTGTPSAVLGTSVPPLLIPAKATEYIMLDGATGSLPGGVLLTNATLQITLVTESGNYFKTSWSPPTALPAATVSTRNYQAVPQDELTLSGGQSYAENATVVGYSWAISVPTSCGATTYDTAKGVGGETLAYAPEALFPTTYATDCITGPISATLTVADSNGFNATSQPIVVPPDPSLDPPSSLSVVSVTSGLPGTIIIQVEDAYGTPVDNEFVAAEASGGLTLMTSSSTTNTMGQVTFSVSGTSGTVTFQAGGIPPLQVPYP